METLENVSPKKEPTPVKRGLGKIIKIIVIAAVAIVVAIGLYLSAEPFVEGFKEGYNEARAERLAK